MKRDKDGGIIRCPSTNTGALNVRMSLNALFSEVIGLSRALNVEGKKLSA
jgi:hypothetical protein